MKCFLPLLLSTLVAGCQQPWWERQSAVVASELTSLVGSPEQVSAFLAEYGSSELPQSPQIELLGRDKLSDGRERLRYRMPEMLAHRDIGGLIFLAQKHGLTMSAQRDND